MYCTMYNVKLKLLSIKEISYSNVSSIFKKRFAHIYFNIIFSFTNISVYHVCIMYQFIN